MTTARTSDLWWKNAVIYCLDVETFLDWDGDGCGDLRGLTERVDYLAGIGISCLWLMPFQPSPNRDDGYDITDFYGVDPRLGSLGDFVSLIRTCKDRGMRVIIDLVVNHTSANHPWFREARSSPDNRFRDFYVWRDRPTRTKKASIVFPDAEDSIWAWDDKAEQYYLHAFYSHQPDLNIGNQKVRDEIAKIAGFWLGLGVDGFRVDAVPFLIDTSQIGDVDLDPHEILRHLRSFISRRRGDGMLLGEVNLVPEQLIEFFGGEDADEVNLLFNFNLMQAVWLALARQDAAPIAEQLEKTIAVSQDCQYANFLRNHDELTLDKLSDKERRRYSRRSVLRRTCSCSVEGCVAGSRRCWKATRRGSGWRTACCSRCRGRRCSSTARRSGWGRTSTSRGAWPFVRRCSGTTRRTAGSPRPAARGCGVRWSRAGSGRWG